LEVVREDADTEWLMIDSTVIRAHQQASGAEKGFFTDLSEGLDPHSLWLVSGEDPGSAF